MRSSSFTCGLVGLLLSDKATAFTAGPFTGALVVTNGRSPVTLSAQNVDASSSSSSRSDFLKTSYATIAAITTATLFAPTTAFAAEDAVDDLSMPSVEETKVSEVSRMQRTALYTTIALHHIIEPRNLDFTSFIEVYESLLCACPGYTNWVGGQLFCHLYAA
jgi:hypothetical protein